MSAYIRAEEPIAVLGDDFGYSLTLSVTRTANLADDLSAVEGVLVANATVTKHEDEDDKTRLTLYRDEIVWLLANLPAVLALMPENQS